MNFVAIDFETANHERHSALSLALVVVRNDQIIDQFYSLIKPATYISARNTQIHGITKDDVADAPEFPAVWDKIAPLFTEDHLVVAHNANFDSSVLKATLAYYGIAEPHYQLLDTVQTSRRLLNLENYKLNTVAKSLTIRLDHHHNALADAIAAAQILIYEHQQFGPAPLKVLVRNK
ncbi:3'-5' exonuclease [Convivina praedatoris]|uniref:DNA polymerase III PolC-type n=1 Tax=Convivina praedatoris TaxID=2880963 RepID=A0ABM9D4I7_9LACO|nr:3'-5' exonuclease [Convivina sp. LMG 32447]CAH1854224.1 DNA polymerase III PolC-type [Convivina sp. LMG 32447]CAH1855553.1 DNA polymerase III PolC-type [Convivina sp. LMG 32447]